MSMYGWKTADVYGVDINGQRCICAKVSVPQNYTREQAHAYILRTHEHWKTKPKLDDVVVTKGVSE